MAPSPFEFHGYGDVLSQICIASKDSVEASIAKPPCECSDCRDEFYTVEEQWDPLHSYRDRLSDADVERRVSSTVKQIHDCRDALTARLDTSADILMSRWRKLSQAKREILLNEAAPGLEKEQWLIPRWSYFRTRLPTPKASQRLRRQLFLPWLNVDVLKTNPTVLFALLHCRTAYPPQLWYNFDKRQHSIAWFTGSVDVDFSRKCVVVYGNKYGSVVDWEDKAVHRADIAAFPRAMLVIEAQAHLMETLHNIAAKILDGVDESHPPRTSKWKGLVEGNAFSGTGIVEYWSPYTNPAFSPPPDFDSKYLLSVAKSRRDATADHIWHLQCDAAYMRRYLKIILATENFKKASEAQRSLMIMYHIRLEVRNHHWWQWVEMECRHVDELRDKYREHIRQGAPLPTPYEKALGALEVCLITQVINGGKRLESFLPFIPGFQKHWTLDPIKDPNQPDHVGVLRSDKNFNTEEVLKEDPLYWILAQLTAPPDELQNFHHSMLFAMLEERLAESPKERSRLNEVTYQVLSDLAVYDEMLTIVRSHRPRNKAEDPKEVTMTESRQAWRRPEFGRYTDKLTEVGEEESFIAERRKYINTYTFETRGIQHHPVVGRQIGASLLNDFYQARPPTGPKTMAWLDQHRQLRAHLEKFWQSIRKTIRRDFEASDFRVTEIDSLMEVVSASLSEAYTREKQQEEDAIIAAIRDGEKPQPLQKFTEDILPADKPAAPRPDKTKTRGQPSSVDRTAPAGDDDTTKNCAESHNGAETIPITVTKHSLDVLHLMFPQKNDKPKYVLWDRFVHAMADAGFVARNAGGSLVSFKNPQSEGRIVFHRPHPDPKIDPIMLQAMGKRMAKWFGWERSLFLLRDEPSSCQENVLT
ncbi:hypothetical protein LLEC1_03268 [Akanthomyces lecanii]|uniref:Uncharacterized protein n=1 Tax=Cordyceps confragosa TaxID=2714763 RepID=A0A179IGH8_CORDF|nr:hypothetical protein LLEC1_03268 [Akanthomyces lecanii]